MEKELTPREKRQLDKLTCDYLVDLLSRRGCRRSAILLDIYDADRVLGRLEDDMEAGCFAMEIRVHSRWILIIRSEELVIPIITDYRQ